MTRSDTCAQHLLGRQSVPVSSACRVRASSAHTRQPPTDGERWSPWPSPPGQAITWLECIRFFNSSKYFFQCGSAFTARQATSTIAPSPSPLRQVAQLPLPFLRGRCREPSPLPTPIPASARNYSPEPSDILGMATSTGLHRTHRYYAPSPPKQLPSAAAEVKLDLIGYLTAKQPFNSPRQQVSDIT